MTALAVIVGLTAAVIGLVFALPCQACRKRRERMEAAYAAWREKQSKR